MTVDRESEAYREAVECVMDAWDEADDVDELTAEVDPDAMLRNAAERALSALLAPSRVTCPTCGGTREDQSADAASYYAATGRIPWCDDCSDGYVEGPPVLLRLVAEASADDEFRSQLYRVLGMEQDLREVLAKLVQADDEFGAHSAVCQDAPCDDCARHALAYAAWLDIARIATQGLSDTRGPK